MKGQVRLTIADSVAHVTLSHPGKLNAMSRVMWQELREVFEGIQQDRSLRCVILAGEGGNFCAGGDISEYAAFRFEEATLRQFHDELVWGGLQAVLNCDVPILAQIDGACMGAGVEIASCCDMRLAGASAKFGAPIAKLGFPMAPRELALVICAAGELSAREMLLSAAVLDAETAAQRGFLNRVLPDQDLAAEALQTASRVARLAPQAARLNKQSFRALAHVQRALAATDLIANAYAYAASTEHREGVSAFVDKRTPQF
jgi:enoyl-CoA hydratase/carnithine racemase